MNEDNQISIDENVSGFAPSQNPRDPADILKKTRSQIVMESFDAKSVADSIIKRRKDELDQSLALAVKQNADKVAEEQRLGAITGYGQMIAATDISQARSDAMMIELRKLDLGNKSPYLASKMRDPNFAAVSHDDVPNLVQNEYLLDYLETFGDNMGAVPQRFEGGMKLTAQGRMYFNAMISENEKQEAEFIATAKRLGDEYELMSRDGGAVLGGSAEVLGQVAASGKTIATGSVIGAGVGAGIGLTGFGVGAIPGAVGGAGTGAIAGMALDAFIVEAGHAYGEFRENGFDRETATGGAITVGVLNAALEVAGAKIVTAPYRKLLSKTISSTISRQVTKAGVKMTTEGLLKTAALNYLQTIAAETGTEVTQESVNILVDKFLRTISSDELNEKLKTEQGWDEIVQRIGDIAYKTATAMLIIGVPGAAAHAYNQKSKSNGALKVQDTISALIKNGDDSKLAKRSPDEREKFMAAQLKGKKSEVLYVDARELVSVLQQMMIGEGRNREANKISDSDLEAVLPGVLQQLAVPGVVDVTIPTHVFLERTSKTELGKALLDHIRVGVDAMSVADARRYVEQKNENIANTQKKIAEQNKTIEGFEKSAREVFDMVEKQLIAAGRSKAEAEMGATLAQAMVVTGAARDKITPTEWLARNPLPKIRPAQAPTQRADGSFEQASRADLGLGEQAANETSQRPTVVAWAKEKFGDRTAPDGSTVWQNFTEWFGDSKVVDAEGKPRVVYHGTQNEKMNEFSKTRPAYFSADKQLADEFADRSYWGETLVEGEVPTTISAYLSMKNPLVITTEREYESEMMDKASVGHLLDRGYDGIIYNPDDRGSSYFLTVSPTQIKSAIANVGTFGQQDPNILNQAAVRQTAMPSVTTTNPVSPIGLAIASIPASGVESIKDSNTFFKKVWKKLLIATGKQIRSKSDESVKAVAKMAVADMQGFVSDNPQFANYYSQDWIKTRVLLDDYAGRPITSDEFLMFRVIDGLTSPNTMLPSNISDTVKMWTHWMNKGSFDEFLLGPKPITGTSVVFESAESVSGTTANIKIRTVKIIANLVKELGSVKAAIDYLREPVTVKELHAVNKTLGYAGNVSNIGNIRALVQMATGQDTLIPRMFIFGQKVGAYTLNSIGDERFTTVDIWESRYIRSFFSGMFENEIGLPVDEKEHNTFVRFGYAFKDEMERVTGKTWTPSSLQALRWFYIIAATRSAGYSKASTSETISTYTHRVLQSTFDYDQPRETNATNSTTTPPRRIEPKKYERNIDRDLDAKGITDPKQRQKITAGSWIQFTRSNRVGDEVGFQFDTDRSGVPRRSGSLSGLATVATHTPGVRLVDALTKAGVSAQPYVELEPTTEGVKTFSDLVRKVNANSKFGTAVYVYSDADYAKKRLFISESGKSGFALSPDGDIVSVFSESGSREGRGAMILATQMGGTKLNCFDTMLPGYYAAHGFRAVARVPWNDEFIPAGWDFDAFGQYNGGRPDVVYMVYEEKYSKPYSNTDGVVVSNPDEAVAIQNKDIKTEADRAATSKAKYAQLVRPPSTEFAQSDQNKNQARGSIDLKKLTARLLSSSDMFTLGHEMAHFYLHVTMDMASKIDASQLIKDDAQRLLNWFGIKDIDTWNSMTLDEQRVHHEAFAYNFEIYLSEGRSPNEEMRGVFQRFKEFMIRTYLTLKEKLKETNAIYNQQFGKDLPILTGEIRQVMDRMIASKKQILEREAIDNFKAQWDTQEESGMDDARWAAYKEMEADAHNSSVEDLTKSSIQAMGLTSGDMTGMRLDFQKQHEQQRKQVRKEEIDKMSVEPIRLAERFLRTGKMTDQQGNDVEMTVGFKLDKESVSALYPMSDTGIKSKPDFNKLKGLLAAEDGLDPSVVAEMFGFTGGPDKFIRDLADLSKFKDELASRVDARMESEFGENTPEVIEEKIQVALHNKARERFVAVEQRWLAKLKTPVNVILKASREKAIEMLSKMRLMDIDPIKFAKAESMAALDVKTSTKLMQSEEVARKSAYTRSYNEQIGRGIDKDTAESEATRVGDEAAKRAKENIEDHKSKYGDVTPEVRAIKASNQRMLLNQLVSEAYKFKDIVAKFEKYAKKVISDPNRKRMGQESSEQIESILSRFGLLGYDIKPSSIPRPTLAEWISNQESKGLSVKDRFDPFVVDERHDIDYKEMTVDQFNGMVDAISIIEAVGKYESKMIKDAKNLAFKQVVPVVVESINSNSRSEPKTRRTPRPGSIAAKKQSVNRFMLQQQRGPNLCRVLDGDNVDGIMTSLLVLSMDANDSREFNFIQRTTKILNDLLAPVIAEGKLSEGEISFGNFKSADHPDGRSFNKEERLAIALNFGNESNAQRVMSGESLTASQVVEVLQTLTSKDWDFVEGVWKHFDEYRPLADALEKKMYGKGLDLVEPREFTILLPDGKFRDISGGYYPLKYDPNAWQNKQDYAAINELNSQRMAAMGAATTSRSYSKARVVRLENKPLLLNMNAMYSGFSEVMHDIVWREWLIESNRVVENSSIREAIIKNYDKPFHTAMKDWIKGIAMGTKSPQIESSLTYFRHNAVSSLMVGKVANIWKHSFDITKTVSTLSGDKTPMEGWKWVLGSLGHVLTSPLEATKEAFDNSPELRHRFSTRFRELNEIKNQVQGQSKTKTFMYTHGLMFHHMLWKVTDVWTWQAAAKKFLSEGKTPEVAYKLADRVLKDSQGSGTVGNLALIEQGGPAMKLFTALSHYFINTSNILYTKTMTRKTGVSGMSKYAMDITQALIVPVILEEVARHMISYSIHHKQKDKHELDADVLMKEYAAAQAIYLLGTVPIAREFAPAADVLITGNYRTYEGPLGMKIVPDTIKAAFQLRQAKADKELRKALLNILGDVTGLPTSQTNATIDGIEALISGESRSPLAPIMGIPR